MKNDLDQILTYEDIRRAIQDLVEEGLVVDSGRKKWNKRTGQYEILWTASPKGRAEINQLLRLPQESGYSRSIIQNPDVILAI